MTTKTEEQREGGPAFAHGSPEHGGHQGMSLRDYFAIHGPEPSDKEINIIQEQEQAKNPHNDGPPKPRRRSRQEIRCALRYQYADAMLKARERTP